MAVHGLCSGVLALAVLKELVARGRRERLSHAIRSSGASQGNESDYKLTMSSYRVASSSSNGVASLMESMRSTWGLAAGTVMVEEKKRRVLEGAVGRWRERQERRDRPREAFIAKS